MHIHFIWLDSTLQSTRDGFVWTDPPRTVFWISATKEEIDTEIYPKLSLEQSEHFLEFLDDPDAASPSGEYFFFVPSTLEGIASLPKVYPISSMWGTRSPWKEFQQEIGNLEELRSLWVPVIQNTNSEAYLEFAYGPHPKVP